MSKTAERVVVDQPAREGDQVWHQGGQATGATASFGIAEIELRTGPPRHDGRKGRIRRGNVRGERDLLLPLPVKGAILVSICWEFGWCRLK
jgi:hypothetical protein